MVCAAVEIIVSTALLPNRESTARLEKPPDQEIRNARKIQSGG